MEKKEEFEHIFKTYFPKVKAFSLLILKSEEDAEDISQDIFAKIWNTYETWENINNWDAYLCTLAKNHIYHFLRHKSISQNYKDKLFSASQESHESDVYEDIYAKELKLFLKLTIAHMPKQRRKIFQMSREFGMSNAEISQRLGISVRTVEHHIYLALAEIKQHYPLKP